MRDTFLFAAGGTTQHLLVLSPVDWLIIAIYFVVVLGIGFYLKRFTGTGEDFFMAGRKMTAWVAGLSFISANLSALETMGWSAQTYQYGLLAAHSYWFNAVPGDHLPRHGDDAFLLYLPDAFRARLSEAPLRRPQQHGGRRLVHLHDGHGQRGQHVLPWRRSCTCCWTGT